MTMAWLRGSHAIYNNTIYSDLGRLSSVIIILKTKWLQSVIIISEYAKRYDILVERFETAKTHLEEVQAVITEKQAQRKMMENFMEELWSLSEQVDYFDEGAWYAMVDFVTVYGKEDVRFTFKNGMEIKV